MGQPTVPSKFDGNVPPGATIDVTFGPWKKAMSFSTPTPTPTPALVPQVAVSGKQRIRTSRAKVRIKGTAVGDALFVKFKRGGDKVVTKRVKVRGNGRWVFKLRPQAKLTVLRFFAEGAGGTSSRVQRVKVIRTR